MVAFLVLLNVACNVLNETKFSVFMGLFKGESVFSYVGLKTGPIFILFGNFTMWSQWFPKIVGLHFMYFEIFLVHTGSRHSSYPGSPLARFQS